MNKNGPFHFAQYCSTNVSIFVYTCYTVTRTDWLKYDRISSLILIPRSLARSVNKGMDFDRLNININNWYYKWIGDKM